MKRIFALALLFMGAVAATPIPTPVSFSAPCVDDAMDLHGDPVHADLVVFAGGNEWFALPAIVAAFQLRHPEVRHIYYETLPPGVLAEQIHAGALRVGELTIRVSPDVFIAGKRRMDAEQKLGVVGVPVLFASNDLAIMVRAGNPKHVRTLADLGRPDVRVAMPNPKTEGIARQIEIAYKKAGGDALEQTIMGAKVRNGTTLLTSIHHRQTPMWILAGKADAGPVWSSEALYQQRIHSGIVAISIPDKQNVVGLYLAAVVKGAPHAGAAKAFTAFLKGPQAQAIYRSYGFRPAVTTEE